MDGGTVIGGLAGGAGIVIVVGTFWLIGSPRTAPPSAPPAATDPELAIGATDSSPADPDSPGTLAPVPGASQTTSAEPRTSNANSTPAAPTTETATQPAAPPVDASTPEASFAPAYAPYARPPSEYHNDPLYERPFTASARPHPSILPVAPDDAHVRARPSKDGTYLPDHTRTRPDGITSAAHHPKPRRLPE